MRSVCTLLTLLLCLFSSCQNGGTSRRVGVDPSWYPLELGARENSVNAFSTDLLTEIGKVEKIPFMKVTMSWDNLMEGLQKDQYEAILSSMPPYIFNEKFFDYSEIYLYLGPVLVVPIDSKINDLEKLSGKEIAVISGSSNALTLERSPGVLIRNYDSIPKALNAILDGTIDGALIDVLSAVAYCGDLYQGKLKISTPPLNEEGLRLITKKGAASDLIKGFNKGLEKLKRDGAYAKLLEKWNLKEPQPSS